MASFGMHAKNKKISSKIIEKFSQGLATIRHLYQQLTPLNTIYFYQKRHVCRNLTPSGDIRVGRPTLMPLPKCENEIFG